MTAVIVILAGLAAVASLMAWRAHLVIHRLEAVVADTSDRVRALERDRQSSRHRRHHAA